MSCDQPFDSECAKALERMFFFIDHELAQADVAEIQRHLDECRKRPRPPSLHRYGYPPHEGLSWVDRLP